jgi:hypothetical protein
MDFRISKLRCSIPSHPRSRQLISSSVLQTTASTDTPYSGRHGVETCCTYKFNVLYGLQSELWDWLRNNATPSRKSTHSPRPSSCQDFVTSDETGRTTVPGACVARSKGCQTGVYSLSEASQNSSMFSSSCSTEFRIVLLPLGQRPFVISFVVVWRAAEIFQLGEAKTSPVRPCPPANLKAPV